MTGTKRMQLSPKEILFIYNSNDLQDRQALGYAKSLPDHKIKEVDLQKDSFTELQVKQIADMLQVEPVSLIDKKSQTYQKSYAEVELTRSGALKAMASKPELIQTPIAVYYDQAKPVRSPYEMLKQDLAKLPSIKEYSTHSNGVEVKHEKKNHKFTAKLGNDAMRLEYQLIDPDIIEFTSTFVPTKHRNKGLGSKMVSHGVEYAIAERKRIKATCPFVKDYIKNHPKYAHLLVG